MTLPRAAGVGLDARVLLFTTAISVGVGIVFGLAPALKSLKPVLQVTLNEGGRGGSGTRHRTQSIFVVVEMALALVLLAGAGLMVRTLAHLWSQDPGFNPRNAMVAHIWLPVPNDPKQDIYKQKERTSFVREVLRRVRQLPGVSSAAMSTSRKA